MHQRWWSREHSRTIPPGMQDDSSKSRRRSRRIYFPVPLLSDSRTGNAVDVAAGMRESLPSFVRWFVRVRARSEEKREEGTGWRIKQRGSCKSRVEARDTSLALSRLRSAYAGHRDWSRASLWPSSSSLPSELWPWSSLRISLKFHETISTLGPLSSLTRSCGIFFFFFAILCTHAFGQGIRWLLEIKNVGSWIYLKMWLER